jgi:L,D-peptidoglycan transpeptidase YkuD (ErfK/YbiS/YcfS/YnhG family)
MGWCNDPKSKRYNREIKIPFKFSYEKLYRRDSLYDLILVLDYNHNPIIKNKGSAIFIHLASDKYKSTAGCIGLKKNNLINLISKIQLKEKIMIK